MSTLEIRIGSLRDMGAGFVRAWKDAEAGKKVKPVSAVFFTSYEDVHRVLAPSRLALVKILAGQGSLSIREVSRRAGRDIQAVHRDITTLINAAVVDRDPDGVVFPYDRIHFEFDVSAAE